NLAIRNHNLDTKLVQIEEEAKRIAALDEWSQKEIVWLDELYDLADRFPNINTIRLTGLDGVPQTPTGKDHHVARMLLKGITTRDLKALDALMRQLEEDQDYYNVGAKNSVPNRTRDGFRFPSQFTVPVDMVKRPPDKYSRHLLPPTAAELA